MKKGQEYIGTVERIDFPNKGIVAVEEGKVLVKNVLPGQKICIRVNKVRGGRGEGSLLEVVEPSPMELSEPQCRHFPACGGCLYQSLPYKEQLHIKEEQVKALLAPFDQGYEYLGIKESPKPFAYRNKMEFSFGDEVKGGELTLGLHKRGSFYDIVNVNQCRLVQEDFHQILNCVLLYCREQGADYYHKMSHQGYLRHLLIRRAEKTGEILVNLVTTSQGSMPMEPLVKQLLALPLAGSFAGILHSINDSLADVVRSDRTEVLYGQEFFYEELLGLKFRISTFSFFQTNSLGAEVLYGLVKDFIGRESHQMIYDLYSGTGTIAQLLSPIAKKVIGVEIVEEAVEAARKNAKDNGLANCEFIAGDVLKVLDTMKEKPDLIVLDPPRDGIHPKALQHIISYGVEKIVYISCKPTSLARDLVALAEGGYQIEKTVMVDMFPGTANVETVVMLSHKKPDSVINVKVGFGEGEGKVPFDNIAKRAEAYKPKERVTYKLIKEYIEAKYGFKVHTAYIAEVKRELGLPMYDAPNAVDDLKQSRKHPTEEKVEAIKDALKYFKVINHEMRGDWK